MSSKIPYQCLAVSIVLYCITTIIWSSILAVFYNDSASKFRAETFDAARYLADSIRTPPIVDIQTTTGSDCPFSYSKAVVYRWPGTRSGCSCNSVLRTSSCKGCNSIPSRDPIDLYLWDGTVYCVKRNSMVIYGVTSCPIGTKKCPDGYACVPNGEDCPINIYYSLTKGQDVPSDLKTVPIKNNTILAFGTRDKAGTPLYKFGGIPAGYPCLVPGFGPPRVNSSVYILSNYKPNGCGTYGTDDAYTTILDTQTEENLYKINNAYDNIIRGLRDYSQTLTNELIWFHTRGTVKILDPTCSTLDFDSLYAIIDKLSDMNTKLIILNCISLGFACAIAMFCIRSLCQFWCPNCFNKKKDLDLKSMLWILGITIVLSVIFTFIYGGFAINYESRYNDYVQILGTFNGRNCFDPNLKWNLILKDISDPDNISSYRRCFRGPQILMIFCGLVIIGAVALCFVKKEDRNIYSFKKSLSTKRVNELNDEYKKSQSAAQVPNSDFKMDNSQVPPNYANGPSQMGPLMQQTQHQQPPQMIFNPRTGQYEYMQAPLGVPQPNANPLAYTPLSPMEPTYQNESNNNPPKSL